MNTINTYNYFKADEDEALKTEENLNKIIEKRFKRNFHNIIRTQANAIKFL